ncbi:MAG: helix-turn-helix domain-containing protein [Acidimicrobiales bacterium]
MEELSASDMVKATSAPIHQIGSAIYLSQETFARAAAWGWANPFAFYFAGRGGVLGSPDAAVVSSAMGFFNPDVLTPLYDEGVAVAGPQGAADRMLEATAAWGRDHLEGVEGLSTLVELADRLVDGAETSAVTLFAGWRSQARVDDDPGRAA